MCLTWEASSWSGAVEASTVLSVNTDLPQTCLLGGSSTCLIKILSYAGGSSLCLSKILSCAGASLSTMLMNWQEDRVVLIKYWPSKWTTKPSWLWANITISIINNQHHHHHSSSSSSSPVGAPVSIQSHPPAACLDLEILAFQRIETFWYIWMLISAFASYGFISSSDFGKPPTRPI